jgi:acyl-CoA reductase-like NAD-dependent aldehyde dehydrogenase
MAFAPIGHVALEPVIGGKRVKPRDGRTWPTFDPASGEVLAEVPIAGAELVNDAVEAASKALKGEWASVLPAERSRILYRVAQFIRRDAEKLAHVESLDSGKPLREAVGDIETSARYFEYYAGIADKLQGDTIPLGPDYVSLTLHEPIGVTAHVIPWNFPLVTTARGIAPALAAGATAVVKPAEQTPLTALLLSDYLDEAGVPAGVYNVVCGPGHETGAAMVEHPSVAHVTFTGSVPTGQAVMRGAAGHVASVTMELGGKSPVVVLADADLDAAREGVLKAIFTNAGQVCSAGSRLIVEKDVAKALLEPLVERVQRFSFGRGIDNPDLGPLVSPEQLSKIAAMVEAAKRNGVCVLSGAEPKKVEGLEGGWFYAPTILQADEPSLAVVQEEIFGPVLTVQIADGFEHAIALANGTDYGLVAGIYSRDVSRAFRFAKAAEAGQVFINQYFAGGVETPFGGTKRSGFGREKGLEAVRSYYRVKTITARI